MKTRSLIKPTYILDIASLVLMALVMYACADDNSQPVPAQGDKDKTVTIAVKVPGGNTPRTYALTEGDENEVATVAILLFDGNGKYTYQPVYSSDITTDAGNSSIKTFTVQVPKGTYDMVVLANANASLSAVVSGFTAGDAKEDVLKQITLANSGKWKTNTSDGGYIPIPMWGEIEDITVTDGMTGSQAVTLTRMVAKIDVALTTTAAKTAFDLKSVRLYNYNDKGRVAPAAANWNSTTNVATAPSVPAGTNKIGKPSPAADQPLLFDGAAITQDASTPNTRGISCSNEIYTFEGAAGAAGSLSTNTCLVVGGRFTGDSQDTYYRIDLARTTGTTTTFLPVLRNHKYMVNITAVSGSGYPSADEAFNAPSANVTASLISWNDGAITQIVFDNKNMLGVSQGDFSLSGISHTAASADNILQVTTDVPGGWTVDKIVDALGATASWLSLSTTSGTAGATVEASLLLTGNGTGAQREAYVHLKAGSLTYAVHVTQEASTPATVTLDQSPASTGSNLTGAGVTTVGSVITVSVDANDCYTFNGWWNGSKKESDNLSFQYTVTGNVTLTAKWTIKQYAVSLSNGNSSAGTIKVNNAASPQNVNCGSTAELTATANPGYAFEGWYNASNVKQSSNATWTTPAISAAVTYTAKGTQTATFLPESTSYIVAPNSTAPVWIPVSRCNTSDLGVQLSAGETFTAELVWTDNSNKIAANSNIKSIAVEGTGPTGYVLVATGSAEGNAVVCIKKGGNILWSWHIWVTNYNPASNTYTRNGQEFMQRNLGALNNTSGNNNSLGLIYQWGRKDPLNKPSCTTCTTYATIYNAAGNVTVSTASAQTPNSISYSVKNPLTYILKNSSGDWYSSSTSTNNDNLWSATKTVYDPCPDGWRVPSPSANGDNPFYGMPYNGPYGTGGAYSYDGMVRPFTGLVSDNFALQQTDALAQYWLNQGSGARARYMHLYVTQAWQNQTSENKSFGYQIVCVKQ